MRYLVIQLARFGDLMQSKRLILSLQTEIEAEVHLCLDESLAPLARLIYPQVVLHPICAHGTAIAKTSPLEQSRLLLGRNIPAFRELAAISFNRVYNLNFSPLNFRLAALFDPITVCGHVWLNGQESVGKWVQLAMRWSTMRRIGLNLSDFWAWHHPNPLPPDQVNPSAQGRGGGLGVVMAGRETRRSLPPRELALLVSGLVDIHGFSVTLLGSGAESKVAHQMLRELPSRQAANIKNLCGATDLSSLVDVVAGFDLLLTPDTGTMHLASALGVPVLATFLSSAWCFETGPYGLGHRVLQAVTDCLPCLESRPCEEGVRCLRPFSDAKIMRYLATGNVRHLPEGLLALDTAFDRLGLTFTKVAGVDDNADLRANYREFLCRHLCAGGSWQEAVVQELTDRLYAERDWMVPDVESMAVHDNICC